MSHESHKITTSMFKRSILVVAMAASACVSTIAAASILPSYQTNDAWFVDGKASVEAKIAATPQTGHAKNVILFVGDGMGISTLTAARILDGQDKGMLGEENYLSFERYPNTALVKTYNTNQQTPDSAGTMTAMVTGVKTRAGVLNIAPDALRADCEGSKGHELTTIFEYAEAQGLSTGVVSTARLTHATPAATFAHSSERNWESFDDKDASVKAKAEGCKDIATQFVEFGTKEGQGDGIDVAFGGGRRHFIGTDFKDAEGNKGKRTDGVNLIDVWKANTSGTYVEDLTGFNGIPDDADKVLGLFNSSHMRYEADRDNDTGGEPSLTEMTQKAMQLLDARSAKTGKGYVLVVESGRIDHAHHAGNAYNALRDTIEFSEAVKAAKEMSGDDTLIMVTADHSHVFTIAGYPQRGNPILGQVKSTDANGLADSNVKLASDGLPYTTLSYANGLGYHDLGEETDADAVYGKAPNPGRHDHSMVDTTKPGFHQEAQVPLGSETHAGEDITLHATGPGSALAQGAMEQNGVFHIMNRALGLGVVSE